MDIVYEILIESGLYLAFLLVLGAFCYSALILFKPKTALYINGRFNSWFSTEKIDGTMDKHVDTNDIMLKNRFWVGSLFLVGALFTLKYLLMEFDADQFVALVIAPADKNFQVIYEILVISIQWLMIITSCVGVVACALLLFKPDTFQGISKKMDTHYSTDSIKESADTVYTALDDWVMRNHVLVGLFLFMGSTYLMVILVMTLV